ncbi:MAG TPA: chemotaxis protein CheW [Deferrisomatales bacterium]|nr:chemotaxis protein CheW [Deferrisomatales bacterium]
MNAPANSYLVVEVGGEEFGLAVEQVATVIDYRPTTPIPGRPGPFLGALNHHGELLPVAPLATLLGQPPRLDPERAVIVVLRWQDALLGLAAERALGLLTPLDRTRLTHVLGRWDGPHLLHTLETEGRRVHVLDLAGLCAELAERI